MSTRASGAPVLDASHFKAFGALIILRPRPGVGHQAAVLNVYGKTSRTYAVVKSTAHVRQKGSKQLATEEPAVFNLIMALVHSFNQAKRGAKH